MSARRAERLRRFGLALLAVAPAVFGLLALAGSAGIDPGPAARAGPAVAGVVSVAAYLTLAASARRLPAPFIVLAGAAIALLGHYGVAPLHGDAGAALVYVGLGLAGAGAATRLRGPLASAGAAAGVAALARASLPGVGRLAFAVSALVLAGLLVQAARRGPVLERDPGRR